MSSPGQLLLALGPTLLVLAVVGLALGAVEWWHRRRKRGSRKHDFRRQLLALALTLAGLVAVILVAPIDNERRAQVLGLVGVLLSAMIALSSTSVLGNALAGLMLRAQHVFRSGDFLQVEEHFGRVSERGLFHTEIQTEGRDLTTFPNRYLAARPFTVLRTPTLVSATVSLGYDVERHLVERAMIESAREAGLGEPFVRILELGDFSITYRVSGLLEEVKQIVSTRSRLNAKVLDGLHAAGIEIVSPRFMNQRLLPEDVRVAPEPSAHAAEPEPAAVVEALMFDKAEAAENLERFRELAAEAVQDLALARKALAKAKAAERTSRQAAVTALEKRRAWLDELIAQLDRGAED